MATVRDIIRLAYTAIGKVRRGAEPRVDQAETGLMVLQSCYDEMLGKGWFGRMADIREGGAYTVEAENERVGNTSGANITVTLPTAIQAFDAKDADGLRRPRDYAAVVVIGATPKTYLYSAMLGGWVRLSQLTENDTAPLSERSVDGLAAFLAIRLAAFFGGEIHPATIASAKGFQSMIVLAADTEPGNAELVYF